MARLSDWLAGARPRTLPAAAAPVLAGTGAAGMLGAASLPRALGAAVVALALQVGVNFANDYSDGIKGTDRDRVGPMRLVASGAASPRAVKLAAFGSFAVAGIAGLGLVWASQQWWLLAVGAAAIAAAWFYTGGRNPYGYLGLGDIGVFVFFGLVAVAGTCYVQALRVPWEGWVAAAGIGLVACALLMVNNVRDIPSDQAAGKRTLAVRLGDTRARRAYAGELLVAMAAAVVVLVAVAGRVPALWGWGGAVAIGLLVGWCRILSSRVLRGAQGRDLIGVLQHTGLLELAYGAALGIVMFVA